jgi:hypothetical protein
MANSDSVVGYSGKAVGCLLTLALYLTSLSRFATDFNSARRHHLFYELSHVTTFLAVERHKKYFQNLVFCYGCVYSHVANAMDKGLLCDLLSPSKFFDMDSWKSSKVRSVSVLEVSQHGKRIEKLRHMTNTNILSLNSNQTYNRQWIETAH